MAQADRKEIIKQASEWLVRLQEGDLSEEERQQLQQWQQQSTLHQRIWEKALQLQGKFSDLSVDVVRPVMDKMPQTNGHHSHKKYLWLLVIIPALSALYYGNEKQQWLADYRSSVGERKTIQLPDGGTIIMNARSAIDIKYSGQQRKIVLRKGEIWIETRHDALKRPFLVETSQGTAQALGTQYLVRLEPRQTFVAVNQGAVKVQSLKGQAQILNLHQQAYFDQTKIEHVADLDISEYSWTKGFLMVNELSLKDFVDRLKPYQKGAIYLEPQLDNIKISGTYPIDDLQRVYSMLAQTYHLEIDVYAEGYWVNIQKPRH
ncbi:MAG: FecR domain-containing protein [Acinetobacter populi]|jgi:transmembrane sensor|uniref:FecR family protein n=1 Tax=Acinetobacter populi TaxID=1582270 RepID=UPI002355886E|nr:FecR domain-containing protein [Acinetobacter populi]MCH4246257.1 FecR domain-containing protein [Acinetobacter populi]